MWTGEQGILQKFQGMIPNDGEEVSFMTKIELSLHSGK